MPSQRTVILRPLPARFAAPHLRELWSTAVHEAAHTVVASVQGLHVLRVTIVADVERDSLGCAVVPDPLDGWTRGDGRRRSWAEAHAMSLFAGREGELVLTGGCTGGYEGDYRAARRVLVDNGCFAPGAAFVGDAAWEAYEGRLRGRARRLVQRHAVTVRHFAEVLMQRGTVEGEATIAAELSAAVRSGP